MSFQFSSNTKESSSQFQYHGLVSRVWDREKEKIDGQTRERKKKIVEKKWNNSEIQIMEGGGTRESDMRDVFH